MHQEKALRCFFFFYNFAEKNNLTQQYNAMFDPRFNGTFLLFNTTLCFGILNHSKKYDIIEVQKQISNSKEGDLWTFWCFGSK